MGEQEQYRVLIEGYLLWPQKSLAWAELCLMGQGVSAADEGVGVSRMVWTHPELLVMPVQRPSQTWLRSSIALAHSPVPEHSISTKKKWDFLGLRSQGNVYTTCGRFGPSYRAAHCADFPAQELVSTQECKPKASWTFCILCFYHAILLIHFHVFWSICVFFIQVYPISPLLVRLIGRWLYLPFHRIWENMPCEQPWFVYKLLP